jgi:hypothetical protein
MAPAVQQHPGTRPTTTSCVKEATVDNDILARSGRTVRVDEEYEGSEERNCFYCLEGWVFLGSLGHDGAEVFDAVRCRKCGGIGRITG